MSATTQEADDNPHSHCIGRRASDAAEPAFTSVDYSDRIRKCNEVAAFLASLPTPGADVARTYTTTSISPATTISSTVTASGGGGDGVVSAPTVAEGGTATATTTSTTT